MNRLIKAAIFVFMQMVLSSAPAFALVSYSSDINLRLESSGGELHVYVNNYSPSSIEIGNPRRLVILPSDVGVEFSVFSQSGQRQNFCAFINYQDGVEELRVDAGKSVSASFTLTTFSRSYCLTPGTYKIICTLTFLVDGKRDGRVLMSNLVELDIG